MSNKAPLSSRLVAIIIDTVIVGILAGLVGGVTGKQIFGVGVGFIVGILYNWYFWTKHNGQTPAKSLLGIRVVSSDGGKVTDLQAIVRYVGYYINTLLILIGWIWAIFDDKHQGFHDKLAGTVVVKA
jgi:uncharacterized RDD family membrane protein YckC